MTENKAPMQITTRQLIGLAEAIFGPATYERADDKSKRAMRDHARGVTRDLGLVGLHAPLPAALPADTPQTAPMRATPHDPPFDGSDPCPVCPAEVRDLAATAHNLLGAMDRKDWPRAFEKAERLREALARFAPISDAHFANRAHSHGDIRGVHR